VAGVSAAQRTTELAVSSIYLSLGAVSRATTTTTTAITSPPPAAQPTITSRDLQAPVNHVPLHYSDSVMMMMMMMMLMMTN